MEYYIVKGGNALSGAVEISGAKNAALAILAASIMTNETVTVDNVPDVSDIRAILKTIEAIGGHVEKLDRHTFRINGSGINKDTPVDNEFVRKIRGSYYLIGSLLGKYGKASVALPGGCNIGLRPIDQHIKGFRALGAHVRFGSGRVDVKADRIYGAHIYMDVVSVGATINIMMASVMADGNTTIENAAKENANGAFDKPTGTLKRSIRAELKGTNSVEVGTNLEYAVYVEHGTGLYAFDGVGRASTPEHPIPWTYRGSDGKFYTTYGMRPKPFLIPAFNSKKYNFIKYVKEEYDDRF